MSTFTINVGRKWEPNTEYIGRGSPLGNPFQMENQSEEERNRVCDLYDPWLEKKIIEGNIAVVDELHRLAKLARRPEGVKLGCFCSPKRCHGDSVKKQLIKIIEKDPGKISKSGAGWMSPSGAVLATEGLKHLPGLVGWKELDRIPKTSKVELYDLAGRYAACQELESKDGNGNGEWHNYERHNDKVSSNLVDAIYRAGFIRIGMNRYNTPKTLEFEGTPEGILAATDRMRKIRSEMEADMSEILSVRIERRLVEEIAPESIRIGRPSAKELLATQQAIEGQGARVSKDVYQRCVPEYLKKSGMPTDKGRQILVATKSASGPEMA